MKKVSIIIPTYNNDKYIDECLESIVNQTYKNLEIIIVNDGSTDKTKEKLQQWKEKDSRLKCFTNKNHGVSYSRNYGIKKAMGAYLSFIDADDVVTIDFIESLVIALEKNNADCSACGITGFYDLPPIENQNYSEKSNLYCTPQIKDTLLNSCGGFLANKLYKTDIIVKHNLTLDEKIAISEDLLFNLMYFNYCQRVVFNPTVKYYYRQYDNSSYNNLENYKWFSVLDTYQKILTSSELLKNIDRQKIVNNFCFSLIEAKYRVKFIKKNVTSIEKKVKELSNQYITLTNFKKMNIKRKIKFLLFLLCPTLVMKYKRRKI